MKDVAALAGVSDATVSRVLNDLPTVNAELAARVQEAALQLGYRRNGVARNLRRRRTDVWALIISDIANPFFTAVARGVEDRAQSAGFSVMLCNSDEDPDKEAQYLDVAECERFAGVIISPNVFRTDLSRLRAAGIPVVAVDRTLKEPVDSVLVDSRAGACDATAHLLSAGWRRPACVTGPARADTAEKRLAGYLDALQQRKVRSSQTLIRHTDYHSASARVAVAALLEQRRPPDSFFVANSSLALGALEEFQHHGLVPGRDVGLIAFDDAPWAAFVDPPLSVVAQPAYEIGTNAADLLLGRLEPATRATRRKVVTLQTTLVVRASSLVAQR
ncbi:MAG: LacI family DNA-binding transcriptional regulator [Jatrophihabitantaceae bacterium]